MTSVCELSGRSVDGHARICAGRATTVQAGRTRQRVDAFSPVPEGNKATRAIGFNGLPAAWTGAGLLTRLVHRGSRYQARPPAQLTHATAAPRTRGTVGAP